MLKNICNLGLPIRLKFLPHKAKVLIGNVGGFIRMDFGPFFKKKGSPDNPMSLIVSLQRTGIDSGASAFSLAAN